MSDSLNRKYEKLKEALAGASSVAVAFSGGVDSSFLLKAAVDALGTKAVAFHAVTPLHKSEEQHNAKALADQLGCRLVIFHLDPLSWDVFTENPSDRCYHCKKAIYTIFLEALPAQGLSLLIDGTNLDDLAEDRPGHRALKELGVATPLADIGISKAEIRRLSRDFSMPTWDKVSSSCLATRIPAHIPITEEQIKLVDRCERFLDSLHFFGCRVRLAGTVATLEFSQGDLKRFCLEPTMAVVEKTFKSWGVTKVLVDLSERPGIRVSGGEGD